MNPEPEICGLLVEFEKSEHLIEAIRKARRAGYRRMEAYTPFPVKEVSDSLGFTKTALPMVVLIGGIVGAICGFALQYWVQVIEYPINVGGKPYNSWPSFIIVTFEMTILFAALAAVLGMFALNGLPYPHHPLFNVPAFDRASHDRFFLYVLERDPRFDLADTTDFLRGLNPVDVYEVPNL